MISKIFLLIALTVTVTLAQPAPARPANANTILKDVKFPTPSLVDLALTIPAAKKCIEDSVQKKPNAFNGEANTNNAGLLLLTCVASDGKTPYEPVEPVAPPQPGKMDPNNPLADVYFGEDYLILALADKNVSECFLNTILKAPDEYKGEINRGKVDNLIIVCKKIADQQPKGPANRPAKFL